MTSSEKLGLLTPQALSKRWQGIVTVHALRRWRSQGIGPEPYRLNRRVFYRIADVEAWEIAQGLTILADNTETTSND